MTCVLHHSISQSGFPALNAPCYPCLPPPLSPPHPLVFLLSALRGLCLMDGLIAGVTGYGAFLCRVLSLSTMHLGFHHTLSWPCFFLTIEITIFPDLLFISFSYQAIIDEFEQKLRTCHTRGLDAIEELELDQGSSRIASSARKQSTGR